MIGIDVGGTKIAGGVVTDGKVRERVEVRTGRTRVAVIGQFRSMIRDLGPGPVGIGVPGAYRETTVIRAPNVPCLDGVDLAKALGKKVKVDNDGRCAALAEHRYGAGRGSAIMAYTGLGTGVSLAVLINGEPYRGSRGLTSEVSGSIANPLDVIRGEMPVKEDRLLSGKAIVRRHRQRGGKEEWPSEIWTSRSRAARATLKETAMLLGMRLARITLTFDPEVIVVGGGVAGGALLREAKKYAKKYCAYPLPAIRLARLKDAGIIGAALL